MYRCTEIIPYIISIYTVMLICGLSGGSHMRLESRWRKDGISMSEYKQSGIKGDFLIYRGKPLVRSNNLYCYGDMSDDYVLFLMVISNKTVKLADGTTAEIPDSIITQIVSTDIKKPSHEKLAKQFNKNGLYDALDIGIVWLNKFNKKKVG